MRKLVSIRKVDDIKPIDGADKIELAVVGGWQCVTKKGEFSVGDDSIYFEIDSFLPVDPRFEFLRARCYKTTPDGREGFHLRTARMRGQISQGLLLPLSQFPELMLPGFPDIDVAKVIGVIKYEPPLPASLQGEAIGRFPSFITKTDQERIQNLDHWFLKYSHVPFECTEKLDGSSMTVYWNQGTFGVCSRNLELKETAKNTYWKVAKELNLHVSMPKLGRNVAVQGELVGEGIQGNPYKLRGHHFYIFDVYDIDRQVYLRRCCRLAYCKELSVHGGVIQHVPVIDEYNLSLQRTINETIAAADGASLVNRDVLREGLVFKTATDSHIQLSFKVVSNSFLLQAK